MQAYCRIPAMLNHSTGIANTLIACQTANIKTIYTSRKFIDVAKLNEMIDHLKEAGVNIIYLEDLRSSINLLDKLKGMLMAQLPTLSYKFITTSKSMRHLQDINSPAVILFTSGSEGTPKGVVLSHLNVQSNRCQINACVDFTSSDKVFNALPVFHSFGLTGGMLLPLLSGVKCFSTLRHCIIASFLSSLMTQTRQLYLVRIHFYRLMPNMLINMIFTVCAIFLLALKNYAKKPAFYGRKNLV